MCCGRFWLSQLTSDYPLPPSSVLADWRTPVARESSCACEREADGDLNKFGSQIKKQKGHEEAMLSAQ